MQQQSLCQNLRSPSLDHFEMDPSCVRRNLSRKDSFSSSAITADDSSSAPGPSIEWTDEKHSLYLYSLETSFVNQLYNSIALRSCLRKILWGPYSYRAMPTNSSVSVHQDGKRPKTNPGRNDLLLESTADSRIHLENAYAEHLTSLVKRSIVACPDQEHGVVCSERLNEGESSPVCSARSSLQHSVEVSDQNFVDAGQEERTNCRAQKRLKRVIADDSSHDQVVPCGKLSKNYASTSGQASSVIERQTNEELES